AKRGLGLGPLVEAITPIVAGFAIQTAYQEWLHWLDRVPAKFGNQIATLRAQLTLPWATIAGDAATIIFYTIVYTGILLLPFLIFADRVSRSRRRVFYLGAVGAAAVSTMIL